MLNGWNWMLFIIGVVDICVLVQSFRAVCKQEIVHIGVV